MNAIIYGNLQEMWPLFVPYDNKEEHMDIEDYVHEYYSLEKFKASYMRVL